jgi:hypothetical protein
MKPCSRRSQPTNEKLISREQNHAALFGIPPTALPVNWSEFDANNRAMLTSGTLGVSRVGRRGEAERNPSPHGFFSQNGVTGTDALAVG